LVVVSAADAVGIPMLAVDAFPGHADGRHPSLDRMTMQGRPKGSPSITKVYQTWLAKGVRRKKKMLQILAWAEAVPVPF
jgi:hypothetical protein